MAKKEYTKSDTGYEGKEMPKKPGFTGARENSNLELYLKDGYPCGDVGDEQDDNYDSGKGNVVGGDTRFGIHHAFENGVPNAGREDISADVMLPAHKANINMGVFKSLGDDESDIHAADASKIAPEYMGIHNTFGIK